MRLEIFVSSMRAVLRLSNANKMLALRRSIAFVLLLIVLIIDHKSISTNSERLGKRTVKWDELPTTFLRHQFGEQFLDGIPNWPHIGHVEMLPEHNATLGPDYLKTKFFISDVTGCTNVSYKTHRICLKSSKTCEDYPYDLVSLKSSPFRPDRRTVIVIHGFKPPGIQYIPFFDTTSWLEKIANLWHKADVNVIRVYWDSGIYDVAVAETKYVARQTILLLYYLAELNGISIDDESFLKNIYLIGHSLGAHIAGFIGKEFDGQIGRITGLDPAGPRFYGLDPRYRLDRGDALFVDAMHTNLIEKLVDRNCSVKSDMEKICRYGTVVDSGHVDLYVNDGSRQPSCDKLRDFFGCSHKRSIDYYISLLEPSLEISRNGQEDHKGARFMAYPSDTYKDFSTGQSFAYLCPITSIDAHDLTAADMYRCSLPVDYLASSEEYRKELTEEFNLNPAAINRYYLLTSKPYVSHHYMLRINVRKGSSRVPPGKNCSFEAKFSRDGQISKYSFSDYKLLSHDGYYKIIVPFIWSTRYSDGSGNFPRFPSTVKVSGLTESKSMRFIRPDKYFARGVSEHGCNLDIESVSVRPLWMQFRHLTGYYTLVDSKQQDPLPIITEEDTYSYPMIQFDNKGPIGDVFLRLDRIVTRRL